MALLAFCVKCNNNVKDNVSVPLTKVVMLLTVWKGMKGCIKCQKVSSFNASRIFYQFWTSILFIGWKRHTWWSNSKINDDCSINTTTVFKCTTFGETSLLGRHRNTLMHGQNVIRIELVPFLYQSQVYQLYLRFNSSVMDWILFLPLFYRSFFYCRFKCEDEQHTMIQCEISHATNWIIIFRQ